jgi:predicted AAA+ superfamily ATPase
MENLIRISQDLAFRTPDTPVRFLRDNIDWSWRLIGIRGARGTGKTTLLLQQMKSLEKAIYLTLDDLYFSKHDLRETVEALRRIGYRHFFLDEVHKAIIPIF